jgi:hypothetical protein
MIKYLSKTQSASHEDDERAMEDAEKGVSQRWYMECKTRANVSPVKPL